MKVRIKIPKTKLLKINPERLYRKVGQKLVVFGDYLKSEIPRRTSAQLDADLNPMVPLSDVRIYQKGHDRPLIDTIQLMNNIQYELKDNQHLDIFNPTEYHKFHILGTSKMPKRDYFGVSEVDEVKLEDLLYEGMMEIFGEWDRELQETKREVIGNY